VSWYGRLELNELLATHLTNPGFRVPGACNEDVLAQ